MPCTMHHDMSPTYADVEEARQAAREAQEAADKVTDILCRVLRALPKGIVDAMDDDVRRWFQEHKAHDAREGR